MGSTLLLKKQDFLKPQIYTPTTRQYNLDKVSIAFQKIGVQTLVWNAKINLADSDQIYLSENGGDNFVASQK